ncbi:MAG: ABC transporter permease [Gemmatimonadota bacterium]
MKTPGPGSRRGRIFGPGVGEDVDRELRTHLEMRTRELVEQGWDPGEAAREAARLFGDAEEVARACRTITERQIRAERRMGMWDAIRQDVRYGLRTLLKAPEFALIGMLTLGLGIGANTAVFSVVDNVLLAPLPYEASDDIVWMRERNTRGGTMAVAWANFVDWREQAGGFQALAAYGSRATTVLGAEQPLVGRVTWTTADLWSVFRARPERGRLTVADDHQPGAEPVGVVSGRFWRNELSSTPLADLFLEVNGVRVRIVGVAADGFDFPSGTDVWVPVDETDQPTSRTSHNWDVVGRLGPGSSLPAAAAEMNALTLRLVEGSDDDPDFLATGVVMRTLHEQIVGDSRRALLLLLGAAGLVLLVACTNLASTLLARGATRSRELAVRASLGAPRGRIARQLLTESTLLALAGTAVGLGVAALVLHALKALGPESIPRLGEVAIDGSVVAFAVGIALLTVLVFGLLPARRLSRPDAGAALREGGRGVAADRRAGVWRVLVVGEVSLALVLLVGSGLVVRSFQNLLQEEVGFDAADVTTLALSLSPAKYPSSAEHADWYRRFVEEVRGIPGVSAAGFVSSVPFQGYFPNARLELDGDLEKHAVGGYVLADAGAFEALDIPLVAGRLFDERDGPDGAHVAVVSESFAEAYWPGENPIGKSVTGGGMDEFWQDGRFAQVVGVVGDVRFRALARESEPTVYFPYAQRPSRTQFSAYVVVEAATGDVGALAPALRTTLQRLDPDVPPRITPLEETLRASVAPQRFTMLLLGGFAVLALVLAAAGIYGVVSYQVAQRTREMGIRLALGGRRSTVRRMVVGQSLGVVGLGLMIGVLAVLAGGRVMSAFLHGVAPTDPFSLAAAVVVLGVAAALAAWIPAARGTRVDPMITMRAE